MCVYFNFHSWELLLYLFCYISDLVPHVLNLGYYVNKIVYLKCSNSNVTYGQPGPCLRKKLEDLGKYFTEPTPLIVYFTRKIWELRVVLANFV